MKRIEEYEEWLKELYHEKIISYEELKRSLTKLYKKQWEKKL